MTVCKRVLYRGTVQGVGFRYSTRRLAQDFAVAGSVRNLSDGRVEVVAEGELGEVERFLDAVARNLARYIDEQTATDEPTQGFTDFMIER